MNVIYWTPYPATRAVGVKDKLWQPGDTIRIKFQNADEFPGMSDKVIQYAAIWLQYAYLYFEYVDKEEEADVKIGFNMDNRLLSWSTIGTDCKYIDQDSVSANFVWLENDDEETIQGEVLRTFGHILGLGFEHQSPASPITLNDVKTIDYYIDNFNLTDSTIINDILPYYNSDQTNYTEFDDESIMALELPGRQTQERPYYNLNFNYTLSPTDTSFVRDSLYPFPVEPEPEDGSIFRFTMKSSDLRIIYQLKGNIIIEREDGWRTTVYNTYNPSEIETYSDIDSNIVHTFKIFGSDTALVSVEFTHGKILSVDATGSKHLERMICRGHGLNQLEISHNKRLRYLWCDNNNLKSLPLDNPNLYELLCDHNNLTSLDISKCQSLEWFFCSYNKLNSLDLTKNKSLSNFGCSYNNLESLDLSKCINLINFNCENNNLSTLDFTQNPVLWLVIMGSNKLTSFKFPENTLTHLIQCENNLLKTIDVSPLKKLTTLMLFNNPIDRESLLTIANNIVNWSNSPNQSGGLFFPVNDDFIISIFNSKGWNIVDPAVPNNISNNYASFSRSRNLSERDETLKEKYLEYFVR